MNREVFQSSLVQTFSLLPESWSQLLLGGDLEEEEKNGLTAYQLKEIENREDDQALHQTLSSSINILDFSNNCKPDKRHQIADSSSECNSRGSSGASFKKARVQGFSSAVQSNNFKVIRKEKLGDRVTALHQIVSPFGKTDTASVLLEATGYIRFLQNQIEALSSPYLACGSGSRNQPGSNKDGEEELKKDLRSRGLCVVPVSFASHFGTDSTGAVFWAPVLGEGF